MNNLDKKCELCSGWGLISKQNGSHVLCPRCEIKKIDEFTDVLDKEIKELLGEPRKPVMEVNLTAYAGPGTTASLGPVQTFDLPPRGESRAFDLPRGSKLVTDSSGAERIKFNSEADMNAHILKTSAPTKKRGRPKKEG